jgi:hypothetical protein
MKLAYSNWHKDMVHDDAIQSELTNITEGQLEFTNTPYVKAFRPQPERERNGNYGNRPQQRKFGPRNNGGNNGGGMRQDNRNNNNVNNKFGKKRFK